MKLMKYLLRGGKSKWGSKSGKNDCYRTTLPVCDPDDIMPSKPCIEEDDQTELKKPRGPITHTELVRFLNKKVTYNALARYKTGAGRVCCAQKNIWKNLKIISKTELYKEAEDLHDLCEELMTNNQENELTKYSKLKKKEFMPLCVWMNLRADNKELAGNTLLAEGTGMVCPTYLGNLNPGKYRLGEEAKAPICFYLLFKDPAFYINSEHEKLCGKRFRVMAHYLIRQGTSKLAKKYGRRGSEDTKKCLWTKVSQCTEPYPETPCHRDPETWPKKYQKRVKQRKTYAINFLNEKVSYVERNNNHQGCCKRRKYYSILKRIHGAIKESPHAESCLALVEAHQATKRKIKKFDKKRFTSFCVLAKQMAESKQNVREGLLRVKKNNRLCVLRAADDSRYDVKDDKAVYCEFVKMRYKKTYKKKFESLCEAE